MATSLFVEEAEVASPVADVVAAVPKLSMRLVRDTVRFYSSQQLAEGDFMMATDASSGCVTSGCITTTNITGTTTDGTGTCHTYTGECCCGGS